MINGISFLFNLHFLIIREDKHLFLNTQVVCVSSSTHKFHLFLFSRFDFSTLIWRHTLCIWNSNPVLYVANLFSPSLVSGILFTELFGMRFLSRILIYLNVTLSPSLVLCSCAFC